MINRLTIRSDFYVYVVEYAAGLALQKGSTPYVAKCCSLKWVGGVDAFYHMGAQQSTHIIYGFYPSDEWSYLSRYSMQVCCSVITIT